MDPTQRVGGLLLITVSAVGGFWNCKSVCVCVCVSEWVSSNRRQGWGCRYTAHRSGLPVGGLYYTHASSPHRPHLRLCNVTHSWSPPPPPASDTLFKLIWRCYPSIKHDLQCKEWLQYECDPLAGFPLAHKANRATPDALSNIPVN